MFVVGDVIASCEKGKPINVVHQCEKGTFCTFYRDDTQRGGYPVLLKLYCRAHSSPNYTTWRSTITGLPSPTPTRQPTTFTSSVLASSSLVPAPVPSSMLVPAPVPSSMLVPAPVPWPTEPYTKPSDVVSECVC
jgi:hypothetical protein